MLRRKNTDSLYIENEYGFYLEKWTIWGWKSVEYLDEVGNVAIYLDNYYIDEPVTHEVGVGWDLIYGDLANGTYRIKVAIYKDNESPQQHELVGYCCAVFEVSH